MLGPERILLALDHPFALPTADALTGLVDAVDPRHRDAICSGNWLRLRGGIRR